MRTTNFSSDGVNKFPSFAALWDLESGADFLNHGSFGACPREVLAYQRELIGELERQPVRFLTQKIQPLLDESRRILCRVINAPVEDVVFVQNATAGVNCVLRSLRFQPGDEILVTNHEYNACANAAAFAAERAGAKAVTVELPLPVDAPGQVVEAVMAQVTPRTRIALIDHITSPTALVLPVEELTRRLQGQGVDVLIDGAHGPGMVPLHLEQLGAAYYTGNCHKWLCTPKTAGFLYVRPDRQEGIVPLIVSHGYNSPRPGYNRFRDLFDWPGTLDPTPWLCVGRAVEFLEKLLPDGLAGLMRRNHALAVWARRMLAERLGLTPIGPEEMLGSMAAFQLPDDRPEDRDLPLPPPPMHRLTDVLWKDHRIEVPVLYWPAAPKVVLRICAQAYNAPEQYVRLAEALEGKTAKPRAAV
ncbi:MAG: aminotransferase class V-fold PLP-dependent enzyme [Pirellulales bacterium]|nr:aminotransferase class V-fold PLP-dependent enzyme [Pirellulales bacterium]